MARSEDIRRIHLSPSELKPSGWLARQLRLQADGLAGNLDKVWPDVARSKWIGGDREGWERVPYWLDGFIPLAYLLDDEDLKSRAKRYVDEILARQQPDGWICPCTDEERAKYDVWVVFLIAKVLVLWESCTGDPRVEPAVYAILKNLKDHIAGHPLFDWGKARWFECLIAIRWLYGRRPEPWLPELAEMLRAQGLDYDALIHPFEKTEFIRTWTMDTHIVNMMMAPKQEALYRELTGESFAGTGDVPFEEAFWNTLAQYHSSALGFINGDECFAGHSPVQGAELCSIAEAMYSFEWLYELKGDPRWAAMTERFAYNFLATTISEDMWTHQYDQMVNQIGAYCQEEPQTFGTNAPEANRFGLEPSFGCCTANMGQAWPKFALASWYKTSQCASSGAESVDDTAETGTTSEGLLMAYPVPVSLSLPVNHIPVHVKVETDYPFRDTVAIRIRPEAPVHFALHLQIPAHVHDVKIRLGEEPRETISAAPGEILTLDCDWAAGDAVIRLKFSYAVKTDRVPGGFAAIWRGPLAFALPIEGESTMLEYEKDGVVRKFPYCDYDILPISEWQYGIGRSSLNDETPDKDSKKEAAEAASSRFELVSHDLPEHPFSRTAPPLGLVTELSRIDWGLMEGKKAVCAEMPRSRTVLSTEMKELVPYGCTTLRIAAFPVV